MHTFTTAQRRSGDLAGEIAAHPKRFRMLSGERPTGRLHLGHLVGSIAERVRLQDLGVPTLIVLADYQLVTDRDTIGDVRRHVHDAVADYIAAGIDPDRTPIFVHSAVPALNQLLLPFLSLITDAELRRNPTVKAELAASGRPLSGLLLTYPVHQAADILFCKANLVPVGKDNLPHVEATRVIARRFNERYAAVFPVPDASVTDHPELSGLDGRKMSKSYGNTIELAATADETAAAIRRVQTDADRRITFDPDARPGVSALVKIAALCLGTTPELVAEQVGDAGSARLKQLTTDAANDYLAPHRARRQAFLAESLDAASEVLRRGNATANDLADRTLDEVHTAMGTRY